MTSLFGSKKGMRVDNILTPIAILVGVIMSIFFGTLIALSIIDFWDTSSLKTADMQPAIDGFNAVYFMFDKLIFIIAILLLVGIGITSYKLASAKVFFLVSLLMAGFLGFIAYLFSYILSQFMSNSAFNAILYRFPLTLMLGTNLHWLALSMLVIGSIALYGKKEKGQFVE